MKKTEKQMSAEINEFLAQRGLTNTEESAVISACLSIGTETDAKMAIYQAMTKGDTSHARVQYLVATVASLILLCLAQDEHNRNEEEAAQAQARMEVDRG